MTITFTWVDDPNDPSDEPPQFVVVTDTSTAIWHGYDGEVFNGLGHAPVPDGEPDEGERSTGSNVWIKPDPGLSFFYKITPHAEAILPVGSETVTLDADASVSITSTLVPVYIEFAGETSQLDGPRILAGQELVSSVVSGVSNPDDDTFSWSVSGGNPFADYVDPPPNDKTPAVWSELNLPVTTPTMDCFFLTPFKATVSCNYYSATLNHNFALTRTINVDRPTLNTNHAIGQPGIYDDALYLRDVQFVSQDGRDYGNPPSGVIGIAFEAKVTTPALFGTGGGWHFVQLVTIQREVLTPSISYKPHYEQSSTIRLLANGREGLDSTFPYGFDIGPTPNNRYTQVADGTYRTTNDFPSQGRLSSTITTVKVGDENNEVYETFEMFVMYKPPQKNSHRTVGVPLVVVPWNWAAEGDVINNALVFQPGTAGMSVATPLNHPVWGNTGTFWDGVHDVALWHWYP